MAFSLPPPPPLPLPISFVPHPTPRYYLFSAPAITYFRHTHHILGVLTGTLPQVPQQNVFLGLPLQLQPEEARLLVEKGVAYIVNDTQWHRETYSALTADEKETYRSVLRKEGTELALRNMEEKAQKATQARRKGRRRASKEDPPIPPEDDALFSPTSPTSPPPSIAASTSTAIQPYLLTPSTTTIPNIPSPPSTPPPPLPVTDPARYALFAHLHRLNYFLSPGLRFGCQFLVYPGDPLRYHSHFLANALEWEEEIELLDLVGGGRLGTGVKKGWMIGGREIRGNSGESVAVGNRGGEGGGRNKGEGNGEDGEVRCFCIEWGGM